MLAISLSLSLSLVLFFFFFFLFTLVSGFSPFFVVGSGDDSEYLPGVWRYQ